MKEHEIAAKEVLSILEKKELDHAVLELPLPKLTILLDRDDKAAFLSIAKEEGWTEQRAKTKEKYLYGVDPMLEYLARGISLEICFQIACRSALNGAWVPLDRCINQGAIQRARRQEGIKLLCPEDRLCYLISKCVYTEKIFSDRDILWIQEELGKADMDLFKKKIKMVFFNFSGRLLSMLEQGDHDHIINELWSFADY